eukprot:365803-Chlamydomonas_euryale.AAC.5
MPLVLASALLSPHCHLRSPIDLSCHGRQPRQRVHGPIHTRAHALPSERHAHLVAAARLSISSTDCLAAAALRRSAPSERASFNARLGDVPASPRTVLPRHACILYIQNPFALLRPARRTRVAAAHTQCRTRR